MKTSWWILLILAATVVAEGRSNGPKGNIPLMPPREFNAPLAEDEPREALPRSRYAFVYEGETKEPRDRSLSYTRTSTEEDRVRRSSGTLFGVEVGTLGRQNTTSSDALGLKLLWGGRAFFILPVARRIYLKPSLGFFFRREGVAKIGVSEHMAEGGLNAQYAFSQSGTMTWLVGMVSRLEVSFSKTTISTLTASDAPSTPSGTSGAAIRYRLGPSLGFTQRITPSIGLLLDVEATFSFTNPVKPYGGFVGGLIFRL